MRSPNRDVSLHSDLIEQAEHLAKREHRRPRQASLRRAVSAAYYALFHLLVREATNRLVQVAALRPRVARAFDHKTMMTVCQDYVRLRPNAAGQLTAANQLLPRQLQDLASEFVLL